MIWTAALVILASCVAGAAIVALVSLWLLREVDRRLSRWTRSADQWDRQLTRDIRMEREGRKQN